MTRAREDAHVPPTSGGDGSFTWTIPLQVTVRLGVPSAVTESPALSSPTVGGVAIGTGSAATTDHRADGTAEPLDTRVVPSAEEAISIDPNYDNRQGYDPDFLRTGAKSVPLPQLSEAMKVDAAVNRRANDADEYAYPTTTSAP